MNAWVSQETAECEPSEEKVSKSPWHTIRMQAYEWREVQRDAREMGMPAASLLALIWRNWRLRRWELSVLPPLPRDPWVGKKEVDSEVKR